MSDLHIGFKHSRAKDILYVLENNEFDRLILVGDIFDISNMMRRPYWDEYHTQVLKKILKIAKKKEVIYIIGNHDYPLIYLEEYTNKIAGLKIFREYIYLSGEKTILCIHGDQMDNTNRRLQGLGDILYSFGLWFNKYLNIIRRWFGLPYWSISKWAKDSVKNLIAKAFNMDNHITEYLDKYQADVLVYGHTHMPYVDNNKVNTGTFVEIATYIIEENGHFELFDLDKNVNEKAK